MEHVHLVHGEKQTDCSRRIPLPVVSRRGRMDYNKYNGVDIKPFCISFKDPLRSGRCRSTSEGQGLPCRGFQADTRSCTPRTSGPECPGTPNFRS